MLSKLTAFIRRYNMLQPGDRLICAVSGGADSIAMLFAFYLLRQRLQINLEAAHFNHHLRGEESDRDAEFVRKFCDRYEITLHEGEKIVTAGKKGLEAAARDARYAYLRSLPGKLATAHTADDNAETVLMHMVRGTGLCGLGGIAPVCGDLIRPMLMVTRQDVLAFIEEYHLQYVTDSSNGEDCFLRNRLRHNVIPLLKQENPSLAQNLSSMALRLREDEMALSSQVASCDDVQKLRQMPTSLRSRALSRFLKSNGVTEPESEHIAQVERIVFSDNPSAVCDLPGNIRICRVYNKLSKAEKVSRLDSYAIDCPGEVSLPQCGVKVICTPAQQAVDETNCFTVHTKGAVVVRSRLSGDSIRLPGGSKSLKKLFIDRKIPAADRMLIPVVADDTGVLGVYGIGSNQDRLAETLPAVQIRFAVIRE